jgi:N-acetylneuraminic acid mutarotase
MLMSRALKRTALLIITFALLASAVMTAASTKLPKGDYWTNQTPMQMLKGSMEAAAVNGKIYTISGFTDEFDPLGGNWTSKAPKPTDSWEFAGATYQNKIYCIGGYTSVSSETGVNATDLNQVYDPATDTWETKAPMPTPRFDLQANVVEGRIYLIGGTLTDLPENLSIPHRLNWGQRFTNIVEVYDPSNDTWTAKTSSPNVLSSYVSAVIKDKIYLITQTSTWIYNIKTDNWIQGAPPPVPSSVQAGGATSGLFAPQRIYIFGENATQIYNPETNSWSLGATIPTYRNGPVVAMVDDKFYVIAGWTLEPNTYVSMVNPFRTVDHNVNEQYTPVGYGTVPPEIGISSPQNTAYVSGNVSLNFTVNKPADWLGFSLDCQENVTVTGNATLANLHSGQHNVTVYANDTYGNTAASETTIFTVDEPASFPTTEAAAAVSGASVAVACIGVLLYLRKRKH